MAELKAIICDLDGTVLDNEHIYGEAFSYVLSQFGIKSPKGKSPQIHGIGVGPNWERFITKYKIKTKKTIDELVHETQDRYLTTLDRVHFMPGFETFSSQVRQAHIRFGLATSNTQKMLETVSEKFNLEKYFEVFTSADEVALLKPDPALFLRTAEKLNTSPENTVVIEDAYAGIVAAHRAGMKVVGISKEKLNPEISEADIIISSFLELSVEKLQSLFN